MVGRIIDGRLALQNSDSSKSYRFRQVHEEVSFTDKLHGIKHKFVVDDERDGEGVAAAACFHRLVYTQENWTYFIPSSGRSMHWIL